MATIPEDSLGLDLDQTCPDALEALIKTLEESLPACCSQEDMCDDVLGASLAHRSDKTDSISSDMSSTASCASGEESHSPSSSCPEQDESPAGGKAAEGKDKGNGEGASSKQPSHTSSSSSHPMVTRRRSEREYNFRSSSIINRIQTEERRTQPRQPKPKSKPPPLSKYRRRTANSRERNRMREINDAFEVLRQTIPSYPAEPAGAKLTKITTLRLALNYIGALREMLGYSNDNVSVGATGGREYSCLPDLGSDGGLSSSSGSSGGEPSPGSFSSGDIQQGLSAINEAALQASCEAMDLASPDRLNSTENTSSQS